MGGLSHLDESGAARMVDVTPKSVTIRQAVAEGFIQMSREAFETVLAGNTPKGDVLGTARLAAIMGAKKTSDLIPLCHPLPIGSIHVEISPCPELPGYRIEATVKIQAVTGVEMEALTAVSVGLLTLYDMAKALDKGMIIGEIQLLAKTGGRSGDYHVQ